MHKSGKRLIYSIGAYSEDVTRQQESACRSTEELSSKHVHQSVSQYRRDVQATGTTQQLHFRHSKLCAVHLPSALYLLKCP